MAYSQFTHEELIDLTWKDTIRPLLLQRYPGASNQALVRANAYAYGGCLIQDIGNYPLGKRLFSDLTHYARSGDFVTSLLRNATTLDEFAFAIGALSHYIGDSVGHSLGINPATSLTFPKLQSRYGAVTYENAPTEHVRTEFGFDVAQTALHRYAARRYRSRIGFRVARGLLYRSFHETYGIRARGILGPARSAVATYQWSVNRLLPAFLAAQIVLLSRDLPRGVGDAAETEFLREVDRSEYAGQGLEAQPRPGIRAHLFAAVIFVIPKIGILRILATKAPSARTEEVFVGSAIVALRQFRDRLGRIATDSHDPPLPNLDLDTGTELVEGQSKLVDDTHVKLAMQTAQLHGRVSVELRNYLLSYFADPDRIESIRRDPDKRRRLQAALAVLRQSD